MAAVFIRDRMPSGWLRAIVASASLSLIAPMLAAAGPAQAADTAGFVQCGYGLVCNGSAPVSGDTIPLTVSGNALSAYRIVQSGPGCTVPPTSSIPCASQAWASLEAEATADVAALHNVPNDSRVTLSARDEIRAFMYARLLKALNTPAANRTPQEQGWLDTWAELIRQNRMAVAQSALDEYNKWDNNPCTYTPPANFVVAPPTPTCELDGGGQLTGLTSTSWDSPPSLKQLEAYGAADQESATFGAPGAQQVWDDTSSSLAILGSLAAGPVLGGISAVVAGTSTTLATAIATGIGSGVAETAAFTSGSAVGTAAAEAGVPVVAAGAAAGVVTVVVVAIVVIAVRTWQVVTALQLPSQLTDNLTQAAQPVDLTALEAKDGGYGEMYTAMLAQTLPDSPDTDAALLPPPPPHNVSDPSFNVTGAGGGPGVESSLQPTNGGPIVYMSGGWFVTDQGAGPPEWSLHMDYVDWNGVASRAAIDGDQFVTGPKYDPAAGTPPPTVLSDHIEMLIDNQKFNVFWSGPHPPTVAPTMSGPVLEGSPITFAANASDPDNPGGSLTYQWTFQDPGSDYSTCNEAIYIGSSGPVACTWRSSTSATPTETYPSPGTEHVKLVVTDAAGLSTTQTFAFLVGDVAPAVALTPTTTTVGQQVDLSGTVTDPGADNQEHVTVAWGDGTTTTGFFQKCFIAGTIGGLPYELFIPTGGTIPFSCGINVGGDPWDVTPFGTVGFDVTHTYAHVGVGPNNTYSVTATADDGYLQGQETVPMTVGQAPTTVTVTPSVNPVAPGQPVTLHASVAPETPGAGIPTGSVQFVNYGQVVATVPLNSQGIAAVTTTSLAWNPISFSSFNVEAVYSGDSDFSGANVSTSVQVGEVPTTTTVTSSVNSNSSVSGQPVVFTAQVTASSGIPTGAVQFSVDGVPLGGPVVVGASGMAASIPDSSLTPTGTGTGFPAGHSVTAAYAIPCDQCVLLLPNFLPSSGSLSQTVNRDTTTTAITSLTDPSVTGQRVTFTATVIANGPGSGAPTGTVSFTDGGTTSYCPPQTVTSGVATCSVALAFGHRLYNVMAAYSGDVNFNASNGGLIQIVNPDSTATTVTSSADPANPGQMVTYSAQVSASFPGSGTPTGPVSFTDGGIGIASCAAVALIGGIANCVTYATTGNHTIQANYAGDTSFNASTSINLGEAVTSCGSTLVGCNLVGANLTGSNLAGANLSGTNLKGASLAGTNLSGSKLSAANLSGANLSGANLSAANLSAANLSAANLSAANLANANLTGDNLTHANLSGASLFRAQLTGANLSGVTWSNTTCPDGTISNSDSGTCLGHL